MKYIFLLLSYLIGKATIPIVKDLFVRSKCLKKNYRGEYIPYTMGIIYIYNILVITLLIYKYIDKQETIQIILILLGILTMGLIGMIDDLLGDKDIKVKGLKGHIKMLLKLKLTTGGMKAVFGGIIGIIISLNLSKNILDFLINFIIINLFTNFINLLDLRPGRALKGFLILSIFFIIVVNDIYDIILLSFIGLSIAYLPYDIGGKTMLGDIGSNVLGITLGITSTSFSTNYRIIIAILLISIHIYCEKKSITKLILNNRFLSYIDNLGR